MNCVRIPVLALALALACARSRRAPAPSEAAPAAPPGGPDASPERADDPAPAPRTASSAEQGTPRAAQPAAPQRAPSAAPPVAARPEAGGPGEYFPLAIGNQWIYVDQSPALPPAKRGVQTDRAHPGPDRRRVLPRQRARRAAGERRLRAGPGTPPPLPAVRAGCHLDVGGVGQLDRAIRDRRPGRGGGDAGGTLRAAVSGYERTTGPRRSTDHVLEITYAPRVGPVRIETYVVVDGKVTPQVKAVLQSYKLEGK